jgi:adenosylcobinamide-phosphate synthase
MLVSALFGFALAPFQGPILLLALGLDAVAGDPARLYRVLPHPVVLMGRAIELAEARLNDEGRGARFRFVAGLALTVALTAVCAAIGWAIDAALGRFSGGWLLEAALASTLIAYRGLFDHVQAVARGLGEGLDQGRAAVGHVVGRDPDSLDAAGVARAAVESLAENFSDGVVAPVFWFLVAGLPGLAAYKAINTLDSMIGHRDVRYRAFGKAAARLDDVVNWLPARLAGLLYVAAAALLPGARAGRAWRVMRRDAPRHRSPNAGWQEAALAGALGFALAGPRRYGDEIVEDHWMGDGRRDLNAADVRRALRLYLVAGLLLAVLVAALAFGESRGIKGTPYLIQTNHAWSFDN